MHYPPATIVYLNERGTTWAASDVTVDLYSHEPSMFLEQDRVELCATDPEGITKSFVVTLRFRNEYYRKVLQKRVCERFCPRDVTEECKAERARKAAKRRERELQELVWLGAILVLITGLIVGLRLIV